MGVIARQKVKGKGKSWWVFISHNGTRKSIKVGSKTAANEVKEKIEAQLKLNGEINSGDDKPIPVFGEYADSWIKTTVPANNKESTTKDYDDILRIHVLPKFSDVAVTDITRADIKNFLFGKLNEGKAKSTVNHYRAVISGVLNEAVDAGIIPANPTHRLGRIGKKEDNSVEINPLSKEDLRKLLYFVQVHYSEYYPLFLLLARTGLRIGEAISLKWSDIDFNGRFINVQRTYSKGRLGTPKNGKSRTVDMSYQLKDALLALKEKRVVIPIDDDPNWIFTNGKGGLIDSDNWRRRVFTPAIKKAEIRRIRVHDLRHTYATLRLSKGDNIVDVANQLGDDQVTVLKVYSHWIPGKKKEEVDALDDPEYTQRDKTKLVNES